MRQLCINKQNRNVNSLLLIVSASSRYLHTVSSIASLAEIAVQAKCALRKRKTVSPCSNLQMTSLKVLCRQMAGRCHSVVCLLLHASARTLLSDTFFPPPNSRAYRASGGHRHQHATAM